MSNKEARTKAAEELKEIFRDKEAHLEESLADHGLVKINSEIYIEDIDPLEFAKITNHIGEDMIYIRVLHKEEDVVIGVRTERMAEILSQPKG